MLGSIIQDVSLKDWVIKFESIQYLVVYFFI